jgi:hypothetical protein
VIDVSDRQVGFVDGGFEGHGFFVGARPCARMRLANSAAGATSYKA